MHLSISEFFVTNPEGVTLQCCRSVWYGFSVSNYEIIQDDSDIGCVRFSISALEIPKFDVTITINKKEFTMLCKEHWTEEATRWEVLGIVPLVESPTVQIQPTEFKDWMRLYCNGSVSLT